MINRRHKRLFMRFIFVLEIFIFACFYSVGPQGLLVLKKNCHENDALEIEISTLNHDIDSLASTIVAWNEKPFYKEKFAREELQMARKNETIYFLD